MYDFIQHYKTLLMACGISLEGSFEDPKVCRIKKFHLGESASLNTTVERQECLLVLLLFRYESVRRLSEIFFQWTNQNCISRTCICFAANVHGPCKRNKERVSEVSTLLFHTLLGSGNEDKSLSSPSGQDFCFVAVRSLGLKCHKCFWSSYFF